MEIKDLENWEDTELSDQELEAVSGGFGMHRGMRAGMHPGSGNPPGGKTYEPDP